MKKVITYGTFDLLHNGHINILKRAKALGDYLIVGVTSENYDFSRGKLNVKQSLVERINNVKTTGLADEIIVEEYLGQKVEDIQKHHVDTFVIGSDWTGKFDYLKEYCEVVYLPRTQGVSSTELRNIDNGILKIGVVGYGRIASRFIKESKYVSGVNIESVFGLNENKLEEFKNKFELNSYYTDYNKFLHNIDAVYIASPHTCHYEYAKKALEAKKHVLCEKPMGLSKSQVSELTKYAKDNNLILHEAIKTAYTPCFSRLCGIAKSGQIGAIKNISANFTKLITDKTLREYDKDKGGGAFNELASYVLFGIIKLLGTNYKKLYFTSMADKETNVDSLTKMNIIYDNAMATTTTAIGTKQEGDMVISGTKGYIYVPAPWWLTQYFEVRYEDLSKTEKFFYKYEGDGLRYEIADFLNAINNKEKSHKLTDEESITIAEIIETFNNRFKEKKNIDFIN